MYVKRYEQFEIGCGAILNKIYYYYVVVCTTVLVTEGYLNPEFNRCYCESCHKVRGDEPLGQCGDPPREYSLPFGWCKFGLRQVQENSNACI